MPKELMRWVMVTSATFGVAMGEGAPQAVALGTRVSDWEDYLSEADKLDITHCYTVIDFVGVYPKKVRHIYRCWRCGRYDRVWRKDGRCACFLKYDPAQRQMRWSEPPP